MFPMTVVSKRLTFEAAHFLPYVPKGHKCSRMHGHSYVVTVHVTGPMDSVRGWVIDFADISDALTPVDALDHTTLNDTIPNPTAENIAWWIAGVVTLPDPVRVFAVEVVETENSSATVILG